MSSSDSTPSDAEFKAPVAPAASPNAPPRIVAVLLYLPLLSILGTLARLSLTLLFTRPSATIPALFYAQFVGCFLFGLFQTSNLVLKNSKLYIALTTGFCGCCTSFSALIYEAWTEIGWVGTLFADEGLEIAGLEWRRVRDEGKTVGEGILGLISYFLGRNIEFGFSRTQLRIIDRAMYPLTTISIITPLFILIFLPAAQSTSITFALLFTIPGVYVRYLLSRFLNPLPISKNLPLGTFTANILGTLILSSLAIVQLRLPPSASGSNTPNWKLNLIEGLGTGFCGCLTTVSTFAGEADGFAGRRGKVEKAGDSEDEAGRGRGGSGVWLACRYVGLSLVVGFGGLVGVLGGYVWSR